MDHAGRLRRLRGSLADHKLDYILITHLPNVHYLCGFTGSAAALLIGNGVGHGHNGPVLFTDGRYRTQAKEEVKGARIVISAKSPWIAAAEWLAARRQKSTLGIEPESVTAGTRDRLAAMLSGRESGQNRGKTGGGARRSSKRHTVRLRSAPPLVERARMIKDAEEILRIRNAIELGASLFEIACQNIRPGATEIEVAAAMEFHARCAGADGMAFSTILASGSRSAIVHGRASMARIPRSGFVVCDFGVILAGYCSDRTRTVHVGRPSEEALDFYGAVMEAQLAAIAAVGPGVTAGEVDAAARRVLRRHKLARYFTHSTGHGLGLEIHEPPRIAAGQVQKLEPGMVITIEPGAYVPGKWGVRIEDVVLVTASGCEVLTPTNKELVVIN